MFRGGLDVVEKGQESEQAAQQIFQPGNPGDGFDLNGVQREEKCAGHRRPGAGGKPSENDEDGDRAEEVKKEIGGVIDVGIEGGAELVGGGDLSEEGEGAPKGVGHRDVEAVLAVMPVVEDSGDSRGVEVGVVVDCVAVVPPGEIVGADLGKGGGDAEDEDGEDEAFAIGGVHLCSDGRGV